MNHRILLHRLTIAAAIGMLVAALLYRSDERPQATIVPSAAVSSQVSRIDQVAGQGAWNAQNQEQHLPRQELAEHNAKLLRQQKRLAPLQSRF